MNGGVTTIMVRISCRVLTCRSDGATIIPVVVITSLLGGTVEEARPSGKKQTSILVDDEDYAELERIARTRRSTVSQVVREFVAEGLDRQKARDLAAARA